jgi:hypothetical protein
MVGRRSVSRRSLRRFAGGELRDLDLGFCGIAVIDTGEGPSISIFRQKRAVEAGFSLLIKEPGLYKLESCIGVTMALTVSSGGLVSPAGETGGFFVGLPFVLRSARADDALIREQGTFGPAELASDAAACTVQDAAGVAAFIGLRSGGVVILRREIVLNEKLFYCDIGGIDAQ